MSCFAVSGADIRRDVNWSVVEPLQERSRIAHGGRMKMHWTWKLVPVMGVGLIVGCAADSVKRGMYEGIKVQRDLQASPRSVSATRTLRITRVTKG